LFSNTLKSSFFPSCKGRSFTACKISLYAFIFRFLERDRGEWKTKDSDLNDSKHSPNLICS
jgi:hypothetical protein